MGVTLTLLFLIGGGVSLTTGVAGSELAWPKLSESTEPLEFSNPSTFLFK